MKLAGLFIAIGGLLLAQNALPEPPKTGYILGPDDQFIVHAVEIDEIAEKPARVGQDGIVSLPLVGSLKAQGLTIREFEAALTERLGTLIRHPQISITITEYRSQPVSVLGAVNSAGVHQLRGPKSLTEVLALAGGVRPDAGYKIKIVRQSANGPIPLPDARADLSGKFSVAEVNLKEVLEAKVPQENIRIFPNDVITVPRAELVYVVGEVTKAGGFVLNENESITILQALALAGGMRPGAAGKNAKVLRASADGEKKTEVAVNLDKVLQGRSPDTRLRADDVLFIPLNVPKMATLRAAEAAINIGTGLVIWRR